jgi:hypothetical protein
MVVMKWGGWDSISRLEKISKPGEKRRIGVRGRKLGVVQWISNVTIAAGRARRGKFHLFSGMDSMQLGGR